MSSSGFTSFSGLSGTVFGAGEPPEPGVVCGGAASVRGGGAASVVAGVVSVSLSVGMVIRGAVSDSLRVLVVPAAA